MLWTIFAILIILWLLGWGFHVAGGLIHLLLVIAWLSPSLTWSRDAGLSSLCKARHRDWPKVCLKWEWAGTMR